MATSSSKPKLLYSLVARGTVVLAEHNTVAGNANVIALRILEKLPPEDTRVSYSQERFMFHVLVHDGMTYLCMADERCGRRIPFAFLEDIKTKFLAAYGFACKEAVAYEYNAEFSRVLGQRMDFFTNDPSSDTISRVKGEILEVKNIMIDNIEKVLDRGERLDLLVDKTEHLQGEALNFRRASRTLRRKMWWQNVRMWVMLSSIAVIIVYFIVSLVCGFNFSKCS